MVSTGGGRSYFVVADVLALLRSAVPILRALQLLLRFFFGSVSPPPVPAALLALALPAPPTPLVPLAPLLPSDAADEVAVAHLRRDVVERGGGERVEVLLGEDEVRMRVALPLCVHAT